MTRLTSLSSNSTIQNPLIRNYDEESNISTPSRKESEPPQTPWQTLYENLDLTTLPMSILICANLTIFMYDTNDTLLKGALWVILLTQIGLYFLLCLSYNYSLIRYGRDNHSNYENTLVKKFFNNRTPVEVWCTELVNLVASILTLALIWTAKKFSDDYDLSQKHIPISFLLKSLFSVLICIEFIHPCLNMDMIGENGRESTRDSCTSASFSLGTSICLKKLLNRVFFRFLILVVIFIYAFYIVANSSNLNSVNDLKDIHYVPPTVLVLILVSTVLKMCGKTYAFYAIIHFFILILLFATFSKKALDF